jgi:ubiquinone/menaquinone biosynthesis C-methylase UbiE
MNGFSETLIERSGYEGDEFVRLYDQFRPTPPTALLRILMRLAQTHSPQLVVDLGCGTGISTRVWATTAAQVVGVEPNPAMISQARRVCESTNVRYVEGFASEIDAADGAADIVTCAQAFHWMEPAPVLAEAARVLRRGGVFAAYDYDVPPVVLPDVDQAFEAHLASRREARVRLGLRAGAATWPKEQHLDQIRRSGRFRYAREMVCHGSGLVDAERVIGMAESIGGPRAIFGGQAPEVTSTFERFRETAARMLEKREHPMTVCYRMRIGIK